MNIPEIAKNAIEAALAESVSEEGCELSSLIPVNAEFLHQDAARYLDSRRYLDDEEAAPEHATLLALALAAGRLHALNAMGLDALDGKFTEQELLVMLDCNCGKFTETHSAAQYVKEVAAHHGWVGMRDVPERFKPLMRKLDKLTPMESFALADALERMWHVERNKNMDARIADWATAIGLKLAA